MSILSQEQHNELIGLIKGAIGEQLTEMGISQEKWFDAFVEKLNQTQPNRKYNIGGSTGGKAESLYERVGKVFIAHKRGDLEQLKALTEGVDADGGYLVPTEFIPELIKSIDDGGSIRSLVRVLPVSRDKGVMPKQISGATLINIDEKGTYRPTTGGNEQPVFGQLAYAVSKYGGIITVSDELREDAAFNIGQIIMDAFVEAARNTENLKCLAGVGSSAKEALGIFDGSAGYLTGAAAASLNYDSLASAYYGINSAYRRVASWLMNTAALMLIAKIKSTTGIPLFAPDPRVLGEFNVLGHRVNVFDDVPTDTETGKTKIGFGDWARAYFLFDRRQLTMLTTNTGGQAFDTGTVETRVDERFDGKPADTKAAYILTNVG